jgi:signal transduction histidine kinase
VIGGAVLLAGLLLTIAGLASARIPGGASLARPGISRSRAFLLSPVHPATWYANGAVLLGGVVGVAAFTVVAGLASAGLTVLFFGIGVVIVGAAIEASRIVARVERWRAYVGEPARPAAHSYSPLRGGFLDILRAEFADESRWRDVLYVAINLPLSVLEFAVVAALWIAALTLTTISTWYTGPAPSAFPVALGTVAGVLLLPVAGSVSQLVMTLHRGVVNALLCTSESRELRREVETLRESRSAVLETEATELHRIERDLHDGAQQRLVMLNIDLGLAAEKVEQDPESAKALILEGQAEARRALAEIRDLVRGIAPSILLDRGLVPALESITGRGSVPTVIRSDLAPGERLPAATERAAYFVVAEALANVAKHSGARSCEVRVSRTTAMVTVEVRDDGAGGAAIRPGGGLDGLASRVQGVDGTFSLSSPPGGPTIVRAELPIVLGAPQEPR